MEGTYSFEVGRLLCGKVRNYLKQCKFKGMNIEFLEGSGWIERTFIIKGNTEDLKQIHSELDDWSEYLKRL